MSLKKFFMIALSALLCFLVLTGCGSGKNDAPFSSEGADDNVVVLSYGEEKITLKEFRYYIFVAAIETAYSIDQEVGDNIAGFDWNQKDEDGNPLTEVIIEKALKAAFYDSVMIEKAKEQGVFLTTEEKKENNQAVESSRIQNGDEVFLLTANSMGISDIEGYKDLANHMLGVEKAKKEISENLDKYINADIELSSFKNEDTVTAQHVLISNDSEKYTNPEATAHEVLEKAKAGVDFAKLIEEYNEDPGATAAGYTFGRGEMVAEFEEASFALNCGEISDVVKTEYGYHIIHRIAGLGELQMYWLKNEAYSTDEKVLAKISVEDIMNAVGDARRKLQEMSTTQK